MLICWLYINIILGKINLPIFKHVFMYSLARFLIKIKLRIDLGKMNVLVDDR